MIEDKLADLETRLAYQDDTIDQLNSVIIRQQEQIQRLEKQHRMLSQQLKALLPLLNEDQANETPPPHY